VDDAGEQHTSVCHVVLAAGQLRTHTTLSRRVEHRAAARTAVLAVMVMSPGAAPTSSAAAAALPSLGSGQAPAAAAAANASAAAAVARIRFSTTGARQEKMRS